jgi:hypothetical protein
LTVLLVVNIPLLRSGPRVLELAGLTAPGLIFARIDGALATYGEGLYWLWTLCFVMLAIRRPGEDRWRLALLFLLGTAPPLSGAILAYG